MSGRNTAPTQLEREKLKLKREIKKKYIKKINHHPAEFRTLFMLTMNLEQK